MDHKTQLQLKLLGQFNGEKNKGMQMKGAYESKARRKGGSDSFNCLLFVD